MKAVVCLAALASVLVPVAHASAAASPLVGDEGIAEPVASVDEVLVGQTGQQQQQHPLGGGAGSGGVKKTKKKRKNIVVVLTDDQDLTMDSVEYMPLLKEHIVEKGITYRNHL